MKKLLVSLMSGLLLCPMAASSQAAEYELSLNLPIPPIHKRWTDALKPWMDELEQKSGGRIKIEPYFAEALSKQSESFDSVKSGLADMTESSFGVAAGQFPYYERVADVWDVTRSQDNPTEIINEVAQKFPQIQEELKGVKTLFIHNLPLGLIIGTINKAEKLDDLKGLKIAAIGGSQVAARLDALGASAVSMPAGDVYMALQQGIIDGSTVDFQLLVSRRFGDLIKHVMPLNVGGGAFYGVMNEDVYNGMPDDLKAVIDEMSGKYAEEHFKKFWDNDQYKSVGIWQKEMGGQVHLLTEAEYQTVADRIAPIDKEWANKLTESGLPGDEILAYTRELEAKYNTKWKDSRLVKEFVSVQ